MKSVIAVSPALLLAGAMLAAPASAQTMAQPYANQPAPQSYLGQAAAQPYAYQRTAQPDAGQATARQQQTAQGTVPQGSYLGTCKEVRMLEDTLTAFCSKGDGTWQTTQLWHADRCNGSVQNAGGDLVCAMMPQVGSSTPPQSYGSAYGGTYGAPTPATGAYTPTYAPAPSQTYAPPAYNGYANATTSWPNAYGTPAYGTYGTVPSQNEYVSPSASKTAQPYGY
jgi:hypothetical protein